MTTTYGGTSWTKQYLINKQWDKCVDFASPMTAWTSEMLKEYKLKQEEQTNVTIHRRG